MKHLIVLISTFVVSIFIIKLLTQKYDLPLSAIFAMCAMLFFTAIGHFAFTKGMTMMMPPIIPLKVELVFLTGILEILLGIGLLIPSLRVYSAWILVVFFLLILPANILQQSNTLITRRVRSMETGYPIYGSECHYNCFLWGGCI